MKALQYNKYIYINEYAMAVFWIVMQNIVSVDFLFLCYRKKPILVISSRLHLKHVQKRTIYIYTTLLSFPINRTKNELQIGGKSTQKGIFV